MDATNVVLKVTDTDYQPATIELKIDSDKVEIHCRGRLVAVQDREDLSAYLARPNGPLSCGDLVWLWSGWQFRIWIRHLVPAHLLAFGVVEDLRRALQARQPASPGTGR
jgi:hypothetical protein